MISLEFDQKMVTKARRLAKKLGSLKNSITKGEGNEAGYLAELALAKHLGIKNVSSSGDFYNRDMVYKGLSLEVKAKRRKAKPKEHYEVSVAKTSFHQKNDIYAFVSVTIEDGEPLEVWLCGFKEREEFYENSKFWPKGKMDFSNGFKTKSSMYNMAISDLDKKIKCST